MVNGTDGIYCEKRLLPSDCWSFQTMRVPSRTGEHVRGVVRSVTSLFTTPNSEIIQLDF
jgi:hypothetical protein